MTEREVTDEVFSTKHHILIGGSNSLGSPGQLEEGRATYLGSKYHITSPPYIVMTQHCSFGISSSTRLEGEEWQHITSLN